MTSVFSVRYFVTDPCAHSSTSRTSMRLCFQPFRQDASPRYKRSLNEEVSLDSYLISCLFAGIMRINCNCLRLADLTDLKGWLATFKKVHPLSGFEATVRTPRTPSRMNGPLEPRRPQPKFFHLPQPERCHVVPLALGYRASSSWRRGCKRQPGCKHSR